MANPKHEKLLRKGVDIWNKWRESNPDIEPELSFAKLNGMDLSNVNLSGAKLNQANLGSVNFSNANLSNADLNHADLSYSNLVNANLSGAYLYNADLVDSDFNNANFINADLTFADLSFARLRGANLCFADLSCVTLIETKLEHADISGCHIYGIAAWNLKTENLTQSNLIITDIDEPEITVDNLEIAQFVYLLLNNSKLRSVIDTLTTKSVLILGRFTDERKSVLDAIRDELRKRDYIPILFDFDKPANRNFSETVMTLASLSRFIIIDLSDPNSSPYEALLVSERLRSVPLAGIFCPTEGHEKYFSMYDDLRDLNHVLDIYQYDSLEHLMDTLDEKVIKPAEEKAKEVRSKA